MSDPFLFYDELRPAGDTPIRVLARIRVLAAEEGGPEGPRRAKYRPNHNFDTPDNRHFFIGQVEIPEGDEIRPGEDRDLVVSFLPVVGIREKLSVGTRWRIQEGGKLIALAEVLSLVA